MTKLLSILFLSIFLFAQFGRVVSYAYCKWETRMQAACDCDKILVEGNHNDDALATLNLNPKWEEPIISQRYETYSAEKDRPCITQPRYTSSTAKGFLVPPFHPPASV